MKDLLIIATIFKFLAIVGILVSIVFMIVSRIGGEARPPLTDTSAPEAAAP